MVYWSYCSEPWLVQRRYLPGGTEENHRTSPPQVTIAAVPTIQTGQLPNKILEQYHYGNSLSTKFYWTLRNVDILWHFTANINRLTVGNEVFSDDEPCEDEAGTQYSRDCICLQHLGLLWWVLQHRSLGDRTSLTIRSHLLFPQWSNLGQQRHILS
jgi:hypothetical protein